MDHSAIKLPVYSKLAQILVGIISLFYILFIGQDIIVPIVFATILAILLNPVVNYLTRQKVNRVIAIFLALTAAIILIGGVGYFIGSQASLFTETFPQLKEKILSLFQDLIVWVSQTFNVSTQKTGEWIAKLKSEGMNTGTTVIGQTLLTFGGILVLLLLLPVYIFMILFYKPHLLEFIARLFQREKHSVVAEVLVETRTLIQSYLIGLLLEAAIVATLNSIGLLILGIQYAILIGIIGALLNVIPYIGGIIAIAIPMIIALATQSPVTALWVLAAYLIVQFIDNNLIVPRIVASKVKINGLVSIIVVLIGGALWGFAGMFLAIPLTAIIKVVFDRIEPLTPFGFLLGDTQSGTGKAIFNFKIPVVKKKKTVIK
ncbi:MAG TPA: AI-2E family transporter [Bacteroidia bacterium]|nr:AI-2E family transporter [Bacteroidia bacterium]